MKVSKGGKSFSLAQSILGGGGSVENYMDQAEDVVSETFDVEMEQA